jgi:type IV pilus assembly protein PilQ
LDGEATTIAGLYRTEETKVRRGIPILKDLPPWFFGLRYLFGYNSNDYLENELIIIVQASLEKTVKQRASEKFATKQTLLDTERDYLRSNLDAVFNNNLLTTPVKLQEDLDDFVSDENQEMKTEPSKTAEEALVESPDTSTDNTEGDSEDEMPEEVVDEADTENNEDDAVEDNELTPEQQRLADELSMPVENPELMVLVPRAFSLNEYLEQQQNGGEEQESYESEDKRFFVIGGSFIVRNNANRFNESLMDEGYDTRILFHPESRFNYVAYQGFATFDEAVSYLMSIRETVNQEAWLFSLPR